ncbi:flagellar biosynthesis protein FliQ [Desulfobulbus oligotrophicus]|jgi:flagellar biosynthetic protein FliQ|uniref:Flagellar biosynthetic protein FliQ n=1 Tax=Desulfobulbus oligotrophicus TaxID=1909699 RepID=A0A7T6AQZ5_9BACT|nr:flagellar biosynthesis protein FliQ [Desulfobulbus oligotrophicus]MDY0389331.1 flagellar biosynthesis protein FliQ [Desulfobulbus oligotrophicus]QQG66020.1 flagellar biosynthesis protein FliQ [Desulfobulbus oligotrophicus]
MSPETVIHVGKAAVQTILLTAAPMLIAAMVIGLMISIFQAATQINEQTMTFIPKIVAVFITLLIFGPWIMDVLVTFTTGTITQIASVGR